MWIRERQCVCMCSCLCGSVYVNILRFCFSSSQNIAHVYLIKCYYSWIFSTIFCLRSIGWEFVFIFTFNHWLFVLSICISFMRNNFTDGHDNTFFWQCLNMKWESILLYESIKRIHLEIKSFWNKKRLSLF